jgi:hypothetical protein
MIAPVLTLFSGLSTAESQAAAHAAEAEGTGVQLVRLRKQKARKVDGHSSSSSSFYTARVFVGQPQPQLLHVTFDTASGGVTLPSAACSSLACKEHRKYRPEVSALAVDVNADGTLVQEGQRLATQTVNRDAITIGFSSLDLGDGSVTGHFLADSVCLQTQSSLNHSGTSGYPKWPSAACAEVGLVAATELSDVPFRAAPYDGSIGLGMHGLSIGKAFSFIDTLGDSSGPGTDSLPPSTQQFALYHGRTFGEAAFGVYNPKRLASPLQWAPVVKPEEGYWQVNILSIRVGNQSLNVCQDGSCRGIIDSCTSKLGVPVKTMPDFETAFSKTLPLRRVGNICSGPDIVLELSGGLQLAMKAEDYAHGNEGSDDVQCESGLASLDLPESFAGVFILGEPLLRRYYTVFDWKDGSQQIGFGLASAVVEGGEEERIAAAAEVAEDIEEETLNRSVGRQDLAFPMLMQALLVRVMVVLCMVFFGTHIVGARSFINCLERMMAYRGLLLELSEFTTAVPFSEAPEGDECVICLGSCEDDPQTLRGVPGLHAFSAEEGGCCGYKKACGPKWRKLPCGHHFHETCIFEWLRKARQCPVCRRHLKGDSATSQPGNRLSRSSGNAWIPLLDLIQGTAMAVGERQ